ncbi:MAG: 2,3-diphosphoglycerate-dependent phosphoglycerate mutase [Bacteroidales bacterium]|jgi:2,3-bisphosphoglycerate-dependent phosphoglycerate mutase|nr:2,3-diphosphoglycerate-dependent phosphoglycerate mutase [Bacteroidales bacterium]
MYKLVLIRHGESQWNKENRFTGWTDVDLSPKGIEEAQNAGKALKEKGFCFQFAYTSYLKRAIKTLNEVLDKMDLLWLPVQKTWRLNEKHYGILQGLNKREMVEKYGEEQVLLWRRSYDICPPPLPADDPRHPNNDPRYANIDDPAAKPATESLKDTVDRIIPYWESEIKVKLIENQQIIIAAHGNSLRAIVKYLKNISNEEIIKLNLPTGIPYVFEFDTQFNLLKDYFLADEETLQKQMEAVANQGKKEN